MHLAEGILPAATLLAGGAAAAGGVAIGLTRLNDDSIPHTALLSAAFFVASLIHVPIGPGNVHLVLNGLCGILLGWTAVPAIFIALLLQAAIFGFGGLTVLGVNTVIMAGPALVCGMLFRPVLRHAGGGPRVWAAGAGAGAMAVLLSGSLAGLALASAGRAFLPAAGLLLAAHAPVAVAEALITGSAVAFIAKVRPEMLTGANAAFSISPSCRLR